MTNQARQTLQTLILAATILVAPGCSGQAKPADAARATVSDAVSGVAGVVAHTESAQRHVEQAIPHTDGTGKVFSHHADDVIRQLRAQGYTVARLAAHCATPAELDALLEELGSSPDQP